MTESKPNPGSDAAQDLGCTCPVLDNEHGRGIGTTPEGDTLFWYTANCPVHPPVAKVVGPKEDEPCSEN